MYQPVQRNYCVSTLSANYVPTYIVQNTKGMVQMGL